MDQKKNSLVLPLLIGFILTLGVLLFVLYGRTVVNTSENTTVPVRQGQPIVDTMEKVENQVIPGMLEVPVFPNATVKESFKRTIGEDNEYYAIWIADTSMGDVISFYETELTNAGWTITDIPTERHETGDESIGANKENMNLLINLEREEATDPTEITIDLFVKN